jgi:hypothetical protein
MVNDGYEWTLEQIVRILEDTDLVFTQFITPETGQGNPFLSFGAPGTVGT